MLYAFSFLSNISFWSPCIIHIIPTEVFTTKISFMKKRVSHFTYGTWIHEHILFAKLAFYEVKLWLLQESVHAFWIYSRRNTPQALAKQMELYYKIDKNWKQPSRFLNLILLSNDNNSFIAYIPKKRQPI